MKATGRTDEEVVEDILPVQDAAAVVTTSP